MSAKKVALVTGANKGIGYETIRQLAPHGFTVLLAARDPAKGEAAAEKLRKEGHDVRFLKLEVTSDADRKAAAKTIADTYGKLDVLVNNAGVLEHGYTTPSTVPVDVIRQTFETNFIALIALTQELLPLIKKSDAGRIVNLSSILGSVTANATGQVGEFKLVGYNASKAAVNVFTVLLAQELKGTAVKVNAAHPGWVKTDMGTDAAPLEVADGAKTSVRLATLPADGPTGGFFHLNEAQPW
ncbi:MAG: short-chain dehydrogenase/reductase [Gemmataceae bacterium]|nr:short-chain dehydrogenase/reductase [Gemmataceae bacterium]